MHSPSYIHRFNPSLYSLVRLAVISLCILPALLRGESPNAKTNSLPETMVRGASLTEAYSGDFFFEGPAWSLKEGKLYFTAFGKDHDDTRILRLERPHIVSIWATNTEGVDGMVFSQKGHLLAAQSFGHRVLRYTLGKKGPRKMEVVCENPKWNQPNDVCEAPNGDIYFTDPDFVHQRNSAVYLCDRKGNVVQLISEMTLPNGIQTSLDGKMLVVSDSREKLWRAYPIMPNGITGIGRVFFNPDTPNSQDPDGMTLDESGNFYLTGRGGVWVVRPDGEALGMIPVTEFCSNVSFGGDDGRTLFITCDKKLYQLDMRVRGFQFHQKNR